MGWDRSEQWKRSLTVVEVSVIQVTVRQVKVTARQVTVMQVTVTQVMLMQVTNCDMGNVMHVTNCEACCSQPWSYTCEHSLDCCGDPG